MKTFSALLLLIVMFFSCKEKTDPIRIGANVWPGYEPLFLARKLGYYNEQDIRLVEYPSASEVLRAFRNGALEAAALTLDEALLLKQDGFNVKLLFIHDFSHGGDVILARPPIKSFKEIKGKRVAIEKGALGAFFITRALEKNDMSLKDIIIKPFDVDSHEFAYNNDEVDVAVTFEPVRSKLLKKGAVEIFTSRDIPNEIVDVMVLQNDVIKNKPEKVKMLLNGWFKAINYLKTDKDKAYAIISERLKLSQNEMEKLYKGLIIPDAKTNNDFLAGENAKIIPIINKLNAILLEHKLIQNRVPANEFLIKNYKTEDNQ